MNPDNLALDVIRRRLTQVVAKYAGHDMAATTEYVLTCYGMVLLTRLDDAITDLAHIAQVLRTEGLSDGEMIEAIGAVLRGRDESG